MDTLNFLFGRGEHINMLQMSVRAFCMFIIMMFLLRFAGKRAFAKKSAFDTIITIMLGAVLARGVVGASPFWSTVAASGVMVILHRFFAWISVKNNFVEKFVKGNVVTLFQKENLITSNLEQTGISKNDLHESLRLETKKDTLEDIQSAFLETNGRISFILKRKEEK